MTRNNPLEWMSDKLLSLATIPMLAMLVHVTADVFCKYAFNKPIDGTLEVVSYYYMVAIVLLPLAFVELHRLSIAVDIVFQLMPAWTRIASMFLVLVGSAFCYGLLAYISWFGALRSFRINEVVMGPVIVLVWPARFILPVTMLLAAAVCAFYVVQLIVSRPTRTNLTTVAEVDLEQGVD